MSNLIPLKDYKFQIGNLSLRVEQFVSSDFKNTVEFFICGKSIWQNIYPNYFQAEQKFLIIKNIIKGLKAKFSDLSSEEVTAEKIKEISKEFLLQFKKIK
jgi:hypothetical protein